MFVELESISMTHLKGAPYSLPLPWDVAEGTFFALLLQLSGILVVGGAELRNGSLHIWRYAAPGGRAGQACI